eukprot:1025337-Prorocentrum_minimum.AAC.2
MVNIGGNERTDKCGCGTTEMEKRDTLAFLPPDHRANNKKWRARQSGRWTDRWGWDRVSPTSTSMEPQQLRERNESLEG